MIIDNRVYAYIFAILLLLELCETFLSKEMIFTLVKSMVDWLFNFIKIIIKPKILLTFGIAWMITNGWSYIFVFVGVHFNNNWFLAVGSAYQAFLWLPITPEKIVTVAISIWLCKLFFPKDKKLQEQLRSLSPNNILKK